MTFRVTTRKEARELGRSRYFIGTPCKHNHVYWRRTSNGDCILCDHLRKETRRIEDPEYIKKLRKRHYEKTKEYAIEYRKLWAKANPERIKVYKERDKKSEKSIARKKNQSSKYRAKKKAGSYFRLSPAYGFEIHCIYTWSQALNKAGLEYQVDHILPINGSGVCGLHVPQNLQVITKSENVRKGNKWTNEEERFYPLRELIKDAVIS